MTNRTETFILHVNECVTALTFSALMENVQALQALLPKLPVPNATRVNIETVIARTKEGLLKVNTRTPPHILDRLKQPWNAIGNEVRRLERERNSKPLKPVVIPVSIAGDYIEFRHDVTFDCASLDRTMIPTEWGLIKTDEYVAYNQLILAIKAASNEDAFAKAEKLIEDHYSGYTNAMFHDMTKVKSFVFGNSRLYYVWLVKSGLVNMASLYPVNVAFLHNDQSSVADVSELRKSRERITAMFEQSELCLKLRDELRLANRFAGTKRGSLMRKTNVIEADIEAARTEFFAKASGYGTIVIE